MKKVYISAALAALVGLPTFAQDVYKVEALSTNDLSGDARYIGMGGAMGALGANISAMTNNPAATGLYRRSDASFTAGVTIQPNAEDMYDRGKSRASFDQAGFVIAMKTGSVSVPFVNLGFNYTNNHNFKQYIGFSPVATLGGLSQSWQMRDLAIDGDGNWLDLAYEPDRQRTTGLACCGYDTRMIYETLNDEGYINNYGASHANNYDYYRVQWGGVSKYDLNISLNAQDRFYFGATVGIYDVDFNSRLSYTEEIGFDDGSIGLYEMYQGESLKGTGVDFKLGMIVRPIADSPFRFGLSFHTPVWYELTASNYLDMESPFPYMDEDGNEYERTAASVSNIYDYNLRTPWRFNISAATTVDNWLALDAEYEYAAYNSASVSWPDYNSFNPYYGSYDSYKDYALREEIKACLQGVHTFRIGAEAKLADNLVGRIGYNYISKSFKDDSYLNLFTDSPSYFYNTNTDYVNLGDINRITLGLGYRGKHFYGDLAYQCQLQKGDVYAFHYNDSDYLGVENALTPVTFDLNRHNIMLTLGYKF